MTAEVAGNEEENRPTRIMSARTRWLAVVTGIFTGVAGCFAFGWGFALIPSFLILGAIVQPRWPRTGRGLVAAGGLWLTFWVIDIGVLALLESRFSTRPTTLALMVTSVLFVLLCDLAIVIEEVRMIRA